MSDFTNTYSPSNATNNQEGTNMTDTTFTHEMNLELAVTKERLANAQQALRSLRAEVEESLHEFAENHLSSGDSAFEDMNTILENLELEGLKRTFTVTVKVSYEFEVEVEASNEDAARDEVDNDIYNHISDNVDMSCYDDIDIEATEA